MRLQRTLHTTIMYVTNSTQNPYSVTQQFVCGVSMTQCPGPQISNIFCKIVINISRLVVKLNKINVEAELHSDHSLSSLLTMLRS